MTALTGWRIRRVHKLLGLVIGLQFLFWTVSGLFFTLYPIEQIRGDHLRAQIDHGEYPVVQVPVNVAAASARSVGETVTSAELRMFLGEPVWIVRSDKSVRMVDASNGLIISPIVPEVAMRVARAGYVRDLPADLQPLALTENPPREYGGPLPAWVIEDAETGTRLYIDASTGELKTIRTNNWRIFDVLWRFHIMDIAGEDKFTTWWMRLAAFLGLTLVLFGFALLVDRARKGRLNS